MAVWRRPLRFALLLFVVGLGLTVALGLRERGETVRAVVVERTDPDAVIQTRGSRIVQADSFGDNLRVVANRQLTYPDGAFKMIDGVEVTVEAREDRDGFTLEGTEASVDADQTVVDLSGTVRFVADNGLEATTESASYSQDDGVVSMPHRSSFSRDDMAASSLTAEYDRATDRLQLAGEATVTLRAGTSATRIASDTATIAQTDGFMTFLGGVAIEADERNMTATETHVVLVDDSSSRVEALELRGNARVAGASGDPGELRDMDATTIRLGYRPDGETVDQATLDGDARLRLYGTGDGEGTVIASQAMEIVFSPEDDGVETLTGRGQVRLDVPAAGTQPSQRVTADSLQALAGVDGTLEQAHFEGAVEYLETRGTPTDDDTRIARAERLDTTLADGLSSLEGATFYGDVLFSDGVMEGRGDQAHYAVQDNRVELVTIGPDGQTPRVIDRRGSVQAESIQLGFAGPTIDASGRVESVLSRTAEGTGEANDDDVKRPALLDGTEAVLVTAETLAYDGAVNTATYSGAAHLWQGDTEFRGETIVLDEAAGNLAIEGAARTRFRVTQINDDTELPEESLTTGRGLSMQYDDQRRQVTYTGDARLKGPRADLTADLIEVYLDSDSNALDRISASGEVTLDMPGRLASGDTLVYYDADGRYEMSGEPVRIVEEGEDECRETTGRTLTFFITADDVSVDGQSEARTQTQAGDCQKLMRR